MARSNFFPFMPRRSWATSRQASFLQRILPPGRHPVWCPEPYSKPCTCQFSEVVSTASEDICFPLLRYSHRIV